MLEFEAIEPVTLVDRREVRLALMGQGEEVLGVATLGRATSSWAASSSAAYSRMVSSMPYRGSPSDISICRTRLLSIRDVSASSVSTPRSPSGLPTASHSVEAGAAAED